MPVLDNNKKKNSDSFFPGDITIGLKYSALNPENVYTLKEAELMERLARVHAAAQLCTGEVQKLLQEIEKHHDYTFLKERFHKASINRYELGVKIDKLPEKQKKQAMSAADHEYGKDVRPLEQLIEGMEYLAGIKDKLSKDSQKAVRTIVPVSEELIKGKESLRKVVPPKKLEIYFEDADKMLTNMQLAVPKYKAAAGDALKNSRVSMNAGIQYISRYFEATAGRLLDTLYDRAEQNMAKGIRREDLILIDGHTVHELLDRSQGASAPGYSAMSDERVKKETALLVAAALQNDTRVEAIIPNSEGKIRPEPVPITKKGCDVKQLTKVKDDFYQKFMSNIGAPFAEKKEYEDTMEREML